LIPRLFLGVTGQSVDYEDVPEKTEEQIYYNNLFVKLAKLAESPTQLFEWRNQLLGAGADYTDLDKVEAWYQHLVERYGPHFVGRKACVHHFPSRVKAPSTVHPRDGVICSNETYCNRWVN
jgi:hypothetical protein